MKGGSARFVSYYVIYFLNSSIALLLLQGEEYEPCQFFFKNFMTVCPNAWIERWNDQREKVRKLSLWKLAST